MDKLSLFGISIVGITIIFLVSAAITDDGNLTNNKSLKPNESYENFPQFLTPTEKTIDAFSQTTSPKIGLLFSSDGDFATHGNENIQAAFLAINDFNDFLKDNGKNWQLDYMMIDGKSDPDAALGYMSYFHEHGIDLIVGPETSAELAAIKPFVDKNNLLVISPSSTAPSLSYPDSIYRLSPDDTNQAKVLGEIFEINGITDLHLLVRDDKWGNDLAAAIDESYENNLHMIKYSPSDPDYEENLLELDTQLKDSLRLSETHQIGVVVIGFGETAEFFKKANNFETLGSVKWFGTDSNANEKKITDDPLSLMFADKVKFRALQFAAPANPIQKNVEDRLVEKLGSAPSVYAYSTYDSIWILGNSIIQANSHDANKIHSAVDDVSNGYDGALGKIKLNAAGDLVTVDYDTWIILDGKWIKLGT